MGSACAPKKANETIKSFNEASAQSEIAMSETNENPLLSPEEIQRRLLKLADSIKDVSDFTCERYMTIMQLPSQSAGQERPQDFVAEIPGTSWMHTLSFSDDPLYETIGLTYSIDSDKQRLGGPLVDTQPVCGMGFDAFRQGLLSIGYIEGPTMPVNNGYYEHRGLLSHVFDRNDISVDFLTQGGVHTGQETCIVDIEIWAPNPHFIPE
jgi:hypothetical protein